MFLLKNQKGQSILEYGLLFVLLGLALCSSFSMLTGNIKAKLAESASQQQEKQERGDNNYTANNDYNSSNQNISTSSKESSFYVIDNAGLLSTYSANRISERSKQLDLNSKAQIVVETLESMNGKSIEEYSSSRFRELGLGDKELNNGVLIVVVPIEKVARIEIGYGLEGAIPDGKAGNIVREKGLKRFEEQNFEKGITDTYFAIAEEVSKEYKPSARKGTEGGAGVTVKWK